MAFTDFLQGLFTALFDYFAGVLEGLLTGALNNLFGIDPEGE